MIVPERPEQDKGAKPPVESSDIYKEIDSFLMSIYGDNQESTQKPDYKEVLEGALLFAHNSTSQSDMLLAKTLLVAAQMTETQEDVIDVFDSINTYSPAIHPGIFEDILNKKYNFEKDDEILTDYLIFNRATMKRLTELRAEMFKLLLAKQVFENMLAPKTSDGAEQGLTGSV